MNNKMNAEIVSMFNKMTDVMSNATASDIANTMDFKIRQCFRQTLVHDFYYDREHAMKISMYLKIDVNDRSVTPAIESAILSSVSEMAKVYEISAEVYRRELSLGKPLDFVIEQKIAENFNISLD